MVFGWFKEHQRQALVAKPFPADWESYLQQNMRLYAKLLPESQSHLRDILRVIIAEKYWEGCGGLEINEEIQVTIAAQAALLLLGIPHDYFPNVESILIYPTAFMMPKPRERDTFNPISGRWRGPDGVVDSSPEPRLGEAWQQGPVILSWQDVLAGGRNQSDGHSVVLHEFAHKLDMRDDQPDGVPHLADQADYENWAEVMTAEYLALVDDTRHRRPTLLNQYAITNGAEFFAVATECFFERGRLMQQTHSRLYQALSGFYHQNPADWG
jgi:Mlc titration factor MtfA (ptsG expression regulator)